MILSFLSIAHAARPDSVGSVDSAEGHVRCQYERVEDRARCDEVVVWAEEAWAAQIDTIGFRAPPADGGRGGSDALDVYLTRDAGGAGVAWVDCDGGDGACVDTEPGDDRAEASSFVIIDPRTDDADFRNYVHHEFAHTSQYATDYTEPFLSFWEGTAVACEHWTDPDWTTSPDDLADYQATPWLSTILQDGYFLADLGVSDDSWYEYGAVAWMFFLDATYGDGAGSIGPALWEAAAAPDATVLDAWEAVSGDVRGSLLEFTAERARMGTDAGPEWAAFAGEQGLAWREGVLAPDESVTPAFPPYPLGVSYYEVPPGVEGTLEFQGDPGVDWAVLLVTDDGWTELAAGDAVDTAGTLAVVDLGAPGFDPTSTLEPASFTLGVAQPSEEGCGCGTPGAAPGLGVVGVVAVARRRRRAAP